DADVCRQPAGPHADSAAGGDGGDGGRPGHGADAGRDHPAGGGGRARGREAVPGGRRNRKGSKGNAVFWLLGGPVAAPAAAPAVPPDRVSGGIALKVSGAVQHPLSLTLPDLRAMPATEPRWERDGQSHTARGADLMALVERAGLKEDREVKNQSLRFAVV